MMAGAGGIFGYGIGNFMKYFQTARNHRDLVEMENRRQDLAEREEQAKEAAENKVELNPDYDPDSPYGGIINAPARASGLMGDNPPMKAHSTGPADLTSQKIDQKTGLVQPLSPLQTAGNDINQTMAPPAPQGFLQMMPGDRGEGTPINPQAQPLRETPDKQVAVSPETAPGGGEIESAAPRLVPRFIPTAAEKARRELESAQVSASKDQYDPSSNISASSRIVARNMYTMNSQFADNMRKMIMSQMGLDPKDPNVMAAVSRMAPEEVIPDSTTFNDIQNLIKGHLDPTQAGAGGSKEMMGQMNKNIEHGIQMKRNDILGGRLKVQTSGQAMSSADRISDDTMVKNNYQNAQGVANIKQLTMNPNLPPTIKRFHDAQLRYNSLLGAASNTDYKGEKTLVDTFAGNLKDFMAKVTEDPSMYDSNGKPLPNGQVNPKLLKEFNHMISDFDRTNKAYMARRAISLGQLDPSTLTPEDAKNIKLTMQTYAPGWDFGQTPEDWEKANLGSVVSQPGTAVKQKTPRSGGLLNNSNHSGKKADISQAPPGLSLPQFKAWKRQNGL